MGNHHIDCDFCRLDTRGLSGVKGCYSKIEASTCWEYKKWLEEDARQRRAEDQAEFEDLERQSTGR